VNFLTASSLEVGHYILLHKKAGLSQGPSFIASIDDVTDRQLSARTNSYPKVGSVRDQARLSAHFRNRIGTVSP
jgi:hypothetical protein